MTILEKGKIIGKVFTDGAKVQLEQQWLWGTAATVGLMQGLKYKGSIKSGIFGGLAVLITLAGANGISNVVSQWSTVKNVLKEKGE